MLNIVFDELTAGGLRLTKDPGTSGYICGEDIVCLVWMLDIGYLKGGISGDYRLELPRDSKISSMKRVLARAKKQ